MQKINLITHFFQRHRKEIINLFWVIWAYLAAHTKNDSINLKKPFTFIGRQRISFILHLCLKILQRYRKLVMLGIRACLGTHKWYYELVDTFVFICWQKINFIPHIFLEIQQRYANLFWVLWACLATHTQNDSINF